MIKAIIFDLGKVLLDWDMRGFYKNMFSSDEELNHFLKNIMNYDWILRIDKGEPISDAIKDLSNRFPQYAKQISQYETNWEETIPGQLDEPVEVLRALKAKDYPVYALTNFPADKFQLTKKRFDFFKYFDGIVVSGEEKIIKPDPAIFHLICQRYNLTPETSLFIDDNEKNINAAKALGFHTILFKHPDPLRPQLQSLGIDI